MSNSNYNEKVNSPRRTAWLNEARETEIGERGDVYIKLPLIDLQKGF